MEATSKAVWETMAKASRSHNETNDCTVKALSVITGLDYDTCHAQLAKQGRKNRQGCYWHIEGPKACKALGFELRKMTRNEYRAKTMITCERDPALKHGKFAVLVSRHVAGMVDGNVIDWSQGKRKRVQIIYQCTAIPGFKAPTPAPRKALPKGSGDWRSFRKYRKQDNLELF